MTTVFEVLKDKVDDEIKSIESALSSGSAKSYDEYQKLCGVIKGLHTSNMFIEDLRRKTEEKYEDDD